MSRKIKNCITITLIICLGACTYFTMEYASNHLAPTQGITQDHGTPPEMPSGNSQQGDQAGNNQIPEKPDGEKSADTSDNENSNTSSDDRKDGNQTPGGEGGMQPPGGMNPGMDAPSGMQRGLTGVYYLLFGLESLGISLLVVYLFLSGFHKKSWKETLKTGEKVTIYILSVVLLTSGLTVVDGYCANRYFTSSAQGEGEGFGKDSTQTPANPSGSVEIDGEEKTLCDSYTAQQSDQSVILVKNGGNLILQDATVTKSGGDSTNTENSEFYGINAGILVTENANATISGSNISTDARGSNAVFSTGSGSKIYLSNSTITTNGSSSARGLDATYGGSIEADHVQITTQGGSCATLATDRGEGTVIVKNSTLETNGSGSPVIYSTGNISISHTKGTANGAQMAVVEGKNLATVENSTLIASGKGNRGDVDQAGVMIYQSMSGDASAGTGTFTATGSTLEIDSNSDDYQTAPMFFITNTDATIHLTNTQLIYGSNILICAKGTSEWGTSGSNGGNVALNAVSQDLNGDILLDTLSTLTMNLDSSSTYRGTINGDQAAKECKLVLEEGAKITLTGDSYVTSLEDADSSYSNIDLNGYKLFVNGTAIR